MSARSDYWRLAWQAASEADPVSVEAARVLDELDELRAKQVKVAFDLARMWRELAAIAALLSPAVNATVDGVVSPVQPGPPLAVPAHEHHETWRCHAAVDVDGIDWLGHMVTAQLDTMRQVQS